MKIHTNMKYFVILKLTETRDVRQKTPTHLFCAFNMLATYCSKPVSSMLYFLNMAPQKEARDCNQRDMLVPSCLNRFLSAPASASIKQYPRTSYEILVRYLSESTTGPLKKNHTIHHIKKLRLAKIIHSIKSQACEQLNTNQVVVELNLHNHIVE